MVKELEELLLFIQLVKGQIIYAGPEIPEILQDSEARLSGTIRQWVHRLVELLDMDSDMTFAQLWTESTTVLAEKSALSPAMVADVDRLGKIVGDMDVDAQISRIYSQTDTSVNVSGVAGSGDCQVRLDCWGEYSS